jgi:hypothetical protein
MADRFKGHGQGRSAEGVSHRLFVKLRTLCYNRSKWEAVWQGKG